MARRKERVHEEENLDRWLVSYADFITLLFAFFVVMYAVSSLNEGKYKEVSASLISAFKTIPRSLEPIQVGEVSRDNKNDVIDISTSKAAGDKAENGTDKDTQNQDLSFGEKADQIEKNMMGLIQMDEVTLRRSDKWLEVEINTRILFPSGDAQLVDTALPVLTKVAAILAPYPNPINVEGFTDNIPINTEKFPSNWELSAARAASVVHLFSKAGVEPGRMSAIAYGEFRPIADNSSVKGRLKNRRVVIAILAEDIDPIKRKNKDAGQEQGGASINQHSTTGAISF
ncbi:MAG: flagellar motor protein MotD [Gammaproteobacteria bacterium]|nr:flagellar motor protein MotD [Gammaproteobacteria bacterium]